VQYNPAWTIYGIVNAWTIYGIVNAWLQAHHIDNSNPLNSLEDVPKIKVLVTYFTV
jgi:hypothetical protein